MTQRAYLIISLLIIAGGLFIGRNQPEVVIFLAAMTALMCVGLMSEKREEAEHDADY